MYHYYGSYSCSSPTLSTVVFGCSEVSADNVITKLDHIKKIQNWIENDLKKQGFVNPKVCILNYQLLRSESNIL